MKNPDPRALVLRAAAGAAICVLLLEAVPAGAQNPVQEQTDLQAMAAKVDRMQRQLDATEHELEDSRAAIADLRRQMQALSSPLAQPAAASPAAPEDFNALRQAVADLREEQSVEQSEIAVHEQAKVETRSRYNLKTGGLVLFNAFQNSGRVDNIDVPVIAEVRMAGASHGANGATLRQSLITLDATGPQFAGAHTYANLQLDFFGGLSTADYTSTAGTLRMRSASILTEWPGWRIHAGLERLLVAQSSPTSYATVGEPALAWSGNLWAWVPQLTAEKTFGIRDSSRFSLAAALIDVPDPGPGASPYTRAASAAEQSRYPGSEARAGYAWGSARPGTFGIGGYISPHHYGVNGSIDAWAGLLDWNIALPAHFAFSGSAYNGQALGGLGGGAFKDIVTTYQYGHSTALAEAAAPYYRAQGLHDAGGWSQVKFQPRGWVELNAAFGHDDALASQLRQAYGTATDPYSTLARNQTFLGNAIFRPRASFLLSLEYRKLRSWPLSSKVNEADIVGLAAGYEF